MAFSPDQVLVAARAWLDATRRQAVKRNPKAEAWLPTWEQLPVPDRLAIIECIGVALTASEPANVQRVLLERNKP